jgi:hypothetical protein
MLSAGPVCSCARSCCAIAHETAGAARTRSSLRPLRGRTKVQTSGSSCREIAKVWLMGASAPYPNCRHPRRRVTQYSRDRSDRIDRPRRTGSPAFAGDDECWRGESAPRNETPPSFFLFTLSSPPSAPASLPPHRASGTSGSCPSPSWGIRRRIRHSAGSCCGRSGRGRRRGRLRR